MFFLTQYKDAIRIRTLDAPAKNEPPIINYLNFAILCGEYFGEGSSAEYYQELGKILEEINQQLRKHDDAVGVKNDAATTDSEKQDVFHWQSRITFFTAANKLFSDFVKKMEADLNSFDFIPTDDDSKTFFEINLLEELKRHIYTSADNSIDIQEDIFKINIELAVYDFSLDCHEETISKIKAFKGFLSTIEELQAVPTKDVVGILLDKCNFLLYKIYLRKYLQIESGSMQERIDFYKEYIADLVPRIRFHKLFQLKASNHYYMLEVIPPNGMEAIEANDHTLSTPDLHFLNKLLRRKKDITSYEKIIDYLRGKKYDFKRKQPTFDNYAEISLVNLVANGKFRTLLMMDEENQFKNIISVLKKNDYQRLLNEYSVQKLDFFPLIGPYKDYYILHYLLGFFDRLIDYLVENPQKLINDELLKKLDGGNDVEDQIYEDVIGINGNLEKLNKLINHTYYVFKNNFAFCKFKKSKPVYLKYCECKTQVDVDLLKDFDLTDDQKKHLSLFSDSSYILPDDYHLIEAGVKDYKARVKNKISSLHNVVLIDYKVQYFAKSFKKEVENKEFKFVQALAMFITISTLVLGTIKAFDNRDLVSSLCIIMALSCSLALFNYFIYWFIRTDNKMRTAERWFLLILFLLVFFTYKVSSRRDFVTVNLQHTQDSLKQFRLYDSLIKNGKVVLINRDSARSWGIDSAAYEEPPVNN